MGVDRSKLAFVVRGKFRFFNKQHHRADIASNSSRLMRDGNARRWWQLQNEIQSYMTNKEKIEISINKAKLAKLLIASIIFVLFGLWILIYRPPISDGGFRRPNIKYVAASAGILFFGTAIILFAIKLKDKRPGLI